MKKYFLQQCKYSQLSSSEKRTNELLEKLILDIKALVLLQGSDAELKAKLGRKLAASQDQSVRKFVDALQTGQNRSSFRQVVIALGELALASLLVVAGTVTLVPTVVGIHTTGGLVQYFAEKVYGAVGTTPISPYVSFMEFALGALLLLSAFYALRQAALNLKEAGLTVRSGES